MTDSLTRETASDPDDLLAWKFVDIWAMAPDPGPRYGGGWRIHVRNRCPGPVAVRFTGQTTGSISEVTPDPETMVTASIRCPHMPEAAAVSWHAFGELPEMLADLIGEEQRLRDRWSARVVLER